MTEKKLLMKKLRNILFGNYLKIINLNENKNNINFIILYYIYHLQKAKSEANPLTVELARQFSSDLFTSNGIPFLEPVVKVVNLTSNTVSFQMHLYLIKLQNHIFI